MDTKKLGLELKKIRARLGLSQAKLASKLSVGEYVISYVETGRYTGTYHSTEFDTVLAFIQKRSKSRTVQQAIIEVLQERENIILNQAKKKAQKELSRTFSVNSSELIISNTYRVYDYGNKGKQEDLQILCGNGWDKSCLFIYLGKQGKHHMFREKRGGWSRTYTDQQLIGKKIQKVTLES